MIQKMVKSWIKQKRLALIKIFIKFELILLWNQQVKSEENESEKAKGVEEVPTLGINETMAKVRKWFLFTFSRNETQLMQRVAR